MAAASKPEFLELVLTCGSWQEAQAIADELLTNRLVACVEFLEVTSKYRWHHALEEAKEIKLIMQSLADNFAKVEAVVKKMHGYETPVLRAIPLSRMNSEAAGWLESEANG